ncbi:hypothetical protein LguiA_024018 [Lonicera macranthoides]
MAAIFSPYYNPLQFNSSDLFSIKSAQSASSSSSDNTSIVHTANDIQRAAAEAAEIFRSPESDVVFENDLVEEIATSLLPENGFYTDDESVFGLEEVLANMAEGLMLPSPHCGEDGYGKDDMEISADMFLWSYAL